MNHSDALPLVHKTLRRILGLTAYAALLTGCTGEPAATKPSPTAAGASSPSSVGLADPSSLQIEMAAPTQQNAVSVGIGLDRSEVANSEQVLLVVRAGMADGWHLYAAEGPTGVGIPTELKLSLPAGVTTVGDWTLPAKETKASELGDVGMYHGEVNFSIPLAVSADAPAGPATIQCEFGYQACTDTSCLRPTKMPLSIPLQITAP